MKEIAICVECHNEVRQTRRLLKIHSIAVDLGIIIKRVTCGKCEDKNK